ncbi:MAG: hypothetical protein ACJ8BC_02865 [Gemmatimonadales bacterium]
MASAGGGGVVREHELLLREGWLDGCCFVTTLACLVSRFSRKEPPPMPHVPLHPSAPCGSPPGALDLEDLERRLLRSQALAWLLITGLPTLGLVAALSFHLPLFAALMAGCLLFATALLCRRALRRFTSTTLRLLITARLVLIMVVGALLLCTSGSTWVGVVSALLLWLVADRLLGRRALYDLWKLTRPGR